MEASVVSCRLIPSGCAALLACSPVLILVCMAMAKNHAGAERRHGEALERSSASRRQSPLRQ